MIALISFVISLPAQGSALEKYFEKTQTQAEVIYEKIDVPENAAIVEVEPGVLEIRPLSGPSKRLTYKAVKGAYLTNRRIFPGEILSMNDFRMESVDVTRGLARETRGNLLKKQERLEGLRARTTILPDTPVMSNQVEKIPDVFKGQSLRLVVSGENLSVSTSVVSQENAHVGGTVRVTTQATKRELTGRLIDASTVEVKI